MVMHTGIWFCTAVVGRGMMRQQLRLDHDEINELAEYLLENCQ